MDIGENKDAPRNNPERVLGMQRPIETRKEEVLRK